MDKPRGELNGQAGKTSDQQKWLNEVGGEPLHGSGFEDEVPEENFESEEDVP